MTLLLASSTTFVNSTPGDSITRSKPLLYGSAPVPVSRLRCRYDHLRERRDLIKTEHMVEVVVDDTCGAIDLVAGEVVLHHTGVAIEEALRISGRLVKERPSQQELAKILPGIVSSEQAAMEGAEQKIGAAGPNLSIAVKARCGEGPARELDAEHDPGGHVFEEARVHAHDLDIADILRIEWDNAGICSRVGGQGAVGRGYSYHHAPISIEVIAETDVVPLRIYLFVRIQRRGSDGATDIVLCLIAAPEFEENAPAVVLLLW